MIDRLLGRRQLYAFDPPDPWEEPAVEEDFKAYRTRRLGAYPFRPRSMDDLPTTAVTALTAAVGGLTTDDVLVFPRTPRPVGADAWVVTPTMILAVGREALALWADRVGMQGVIAAMPFDEVAGFVDRTILLFGRLEIVGVGRSIVLRYNTVGREVLRAVLLELRRSFRPPVAGQRAAGPRPESLPYRWMVLLRSRDILPTGPDPLVVAAGDLDNPRARHHNGIAALSSTELLIATTPADDAQRDPYGVDLVVVPRQRLRELRAEDETVIATVDVLGRRIDLRVAVDPSLSGAIGATLLPLVGRS